MFMKASCIIIKILDSYIFLIILSNIYTFKYACKVCYLKITIFASENRGLIQGILAKNEKVAPE